VKYIRKNDAAAKPVKRKYKRLLAEKKCSVCGPKLASEFYPRGGTGLLQSRCKGCTKTAAMASKKVKAERRPTPFNRVLDV